MARGDPIQIMGGLFIPNSRFLYDTDFVYVASGENMPDGWAKYGTVYGGFTVNLAEGFSDHRALVLSVVAPGSGNYNSLISGPTPPGSVMIRQSATMNVKIRHRLAYQKTNGNGDFGARIVIYNADESLSYTSGYSAIASAATSGWTLPGAGAALVPANFSDLGFYPDHARYLIQIGNTTGNTTVVVDDIVAGIKLSDPPGAVSPTYDTISMQPGLSGTSIARERLGRFDRTHLGQMRYVDPTGGALTHRVAITYEAATLNDRKLWDMAWDYCRGLYAYGGGNASEYVAPVAPSPLVIEPNFFDGATQSAGKQPEMFYAWLINEPEWEAVGFLGNRWRGQIELAEVG